MTSPNDGQIYWDTTDNNLFVWSANASQWLNLGSDGVTNLSEGTATTTSVDVNSSTGTDATIAQASSSRAGVLSSAKFDEIEANTLKVSNVDHPLVEKAVPSNAVFTDTETTTSLGLSANILTYTDEDGTDTDIDLSLYLDYSK